VKSTENLNKLRDLSDDELEARRGEMAEEAFRLRFQMTMGQAEALNKMRLLRKDRARVLTILRERAQEKQKAV